MENSKPTPTRSVVVDMSSQAIASRLREVSELYELGMSLARAKPCMPPNEQTADKKCQRPTDSAIMHRE